MTDDRAKAEAKARALGRAHEFNAEHREHVIEVDENGVTHDMLDEALADLILRVQEEARQKPDWSHDAHVRMLNAKIEELTKDRTMAQIKSNRVAVEKRDAEVKRVVEEVTASENPRDRVLRDEILRRLGLSEGEEPKK
jgi:hypothetical protein